ncbi:MAG TPA: serine hydrolase domain-containing protein [Chitinophagaceae bacterium]|nr:serine hydrolase domain-containing protein [Chitinophagaceae bacterium]
MRKIGLTTTMFFAFFWLTLTTLAQQPVLFDPSYKPAVYSDPDRLEKIKKAFPVIDNLFRKTATDNHFPGLAWGIVVDGKLVHTGNYGFTDIEKKVPVTSSSLFRIASMSKSFTAMAILKLRDDGKLDLDDPAYKFIPELKNLKYPTSDSPPITVRHLLTHGGGFPEDNPWGDRQLADTDKELMEFIGKQIIFSNPPGIEYEYSNLGFALLGKIITNASGQRYQDYIRNNIWKPLGIHTTEWEYANIAPEKLAHGYRWLNEKWNEEALLHDTPDGSWGAMGSMISSVEEFSSYMAFHLSAWPPNNAKETGPVKRSSVREMHHPWRLNGFNPMYKFPDGRICAMVSAYAYGLGWTIDCEGRKYIAHSGGLPGFGSQWRIMPDYGIGVVAFANRTYAGVGGVNLQVLDTMVKIAGLKPAELPASVILEKRKNELVKLLPGWTNAEKSGIFAENFFPDNPIDSLRKQAKEIFEKAGKIIAVKEMVPFNQLRGRFIIEAEKGDIEVFFTLSPENPPLIQEYRIRSIGKK